MEWNTVEDLLSSPCVFCGYNRDKYWQPGSHPSECPWHDVGGIKQRKEKMQSLVPDILEGWANR